MARDRALEREWLERAARDPEFAPRVAARLAEGERLYGSGADPPDLPTATLRQLLGEICEEALDVSGWGVLALQLPPPPDASHDAVECVHELLALAADLGAQIDLLMRTAATLLPHDPDAPAA